MTIASPFTTSYLAATLRASIRGDVVTPDDASFPAATFGLTSTDAQPDLAIIAADARDVAAALRLATRTGHRVVVAGARPVRAGSGTILLVTRLLTQVLVDPVARTAAIGVGASWRQVIDRTAPLGLAPVSADPEPTPSDQVDRLSTLCRGLGLSVDHVRGFELVGRLGEPIQVALLRDPELFRSLRGSSSGLIASVTIELFPAGPLYAGGLLFSAATGPAVLRAWQSWSAVLPGACTTTAQWRQLPDLPQVPADLRGRSVLLIRFAHIGDPVDGNRLIAPLRAAATPILDTVEERPWSAVVGAAAAASPVAEIRESYQPIGTSIGSAR
jgi:FAD/FMN-containing dehydrogenase